MATLADAPNPSGDGLGRPAARVRRRPPRDYAPGIEPAGRTERRPDNDDAKGCLSTVELPRNDPKQDLYSSVRIREPGIRVRHPGMQNDPVPPASHVFGVSTKPPVGDTHLLQHTREGDLLSRMNAEVREQQYATAKREPLGHSKHYGFKMPPELAQGEKAFGVKTTGFDDAKTAIFPTDVVEDKEASEIYKRSHHAHAPGEQKRRGYNWQRVGATDNPDDPDDFRFGKTFKLGDDNVANTIDMDSNTSAITKTKIVARRQGDFRKDFKECLGHSKPVGRRNPELPPDHTFGVSTAGRDQWGAGALINGAFSKDEQKPDKDLGKSVRAPEVQDRDTRVFGVPTVRTDVPEPIARSITDNSNYGTEPTAKGVIRPPKYAYMGLFEDDFSEPRTRDELHSLFIGSGMEMTEEEFALCWNAGTEKYNVDELSVSQFRQIQMILLD
eukprot:TRINITY_DN25171_c0_g1_i1.p1 TRINITY_DN25171_c0_g1~~TRINITY_DN25171_c0_g1_i1.p1  ORF type:complete len:442 (+),score=88.56 TRINITY_DN25171_c0_g1_i1:280-1605(+)